MQAPRTAALIGLLILAPLTASAQTPERETNCSDRIDNDKDSVFDCGDSDCYEDPACKSSGGLENSDLLCDDRIDNDGDGKVDCDDVDCQGRGVTVCKGSWKGPVTGGAAGRPTGGGEVELGEDIPELGEGMSVEDLIGKGGDIDGERNNFVCSDGFDNDGDGKTDCADFGCRFDPNVTVCTGTPGLRFSLVANISHGYTIRVDDDADPSAGNNTEDNGQWDTRFRILQLRAFGPVPFIQDSFFLLSVRADGAPRLTFAMFQMPIAGGHFVNINSGGGGLSNGLILSNAKNPLLDRPFYLYSAFEAGNGAALEFNGPIWGNMLQYRAFIAGGAGRFNGNVGGRFFTNDQFNYTYGAGAQLQLYLGGRFGRFDTRYLYVPVPFALSMFLGGRYDQREFERFPAFNFSVLSRWKWFLLAAEAYYKRELEFDSNQGSFNVQFGALVWPKHIFLAGDIGMFRSSEFASAPDNLNAELRRLRPEFMWRIAAHFYVWRNQGLLSLLYTDRMLDAVEGATNQVDEHTREIRVEAQFRW